MKTCKIDPLIKLHNSLTTTCLLYGNWSKTIATTNDHGLSTITSSTVTFIVKL